MLIVWYEVGCAQCSETNFIDNGDPSDMTVPDATGFVCWSCSANNEITEDGAELCDGVKHLDGEHFEKVT